MSFSRSELAWLGCPLGLMMALAMAGCGGGESDHVSAGGGPSHASHAPQPPSTAFVPPQGGGGGPIAEDSSYSGAPSRHAKLGGIGRTLRDEELRRRAAIERAHRPPGPERLTGEDAEEQRMADWIEASRVHPITSVEDDACERSWAQQEATAAAFHTKRRDGLHGGARPSDRSAFLERCRRQSPEAQQCLDPAYLAAHQDTCQTARDEQQRETRRALHPTAPPPPRDPADHG